MGDLFLWLIVIIGFAGLGVSMTRLSEQDRLDKQRKTYRLSFPNDLTDQQVLAWLRAISGTLRPLGMFGPTPALVFEVFAANHLIIHRIRVPFGHEAYVLSQLRLVGINAVPETDFDSRDWNAAVEVGMRNSSRNLRIYSAVDTSASLLANFQALNEDQAMLMQWVVSPTSPTPLPVQNEALSHQFNVRAVTNGNTAGHDEVADRRKKLEEPNFVAVLRVAAFARTDKSAEALIARVKASLAAIRGPHVRFEKRWVLRTTLLERLRRGSVPVIFPAQVSAAELSALLAWRIGNPLISGLAQSMTRPMPASAAVATEGLEFGTSTMPGQERPIALAYNNAPKHIHVVGPPGVGKTTLLRNLVYQVMRDGYGAIVIESKKDLFVQALEVIPDHRLNDVIILDLDDKVRPVGFNILDQGNSRTAIDEISTVISNMYKDGSRSITAPQVLYHMLHALAEVPGSTFVDLPALLSNHPKTDPLNEWQDSVARTVKEADIKAYLQRYLNMTPKERDALAAPVYNRTWEFTNRPEIKRLFGQRTSSFQMTDVIRDNKILLVNLNGANVGGVTASIAGTLLVNAVWQAVRAVQAEKPNFLFLDEFQSFTNLAVDMEDMLAKSRSANLPLVLAHQFISQLDTTRRSAVMANTATKFAFETTADDAAILAREFRGRYQIDAADFMSLARHEGIALLATDEGKSPPTTVLTKAPKSPTGNEAKAVTLSRLRYGRPAPDVDRQINERIVAKSDKPEVKRPRIGW